MHLYHIFIDQYTPIAGSNESYETFNKSVKTYF